MRPVDRPADEVVVRRAFSDQTADVVGRNEPQLIEVSSDRSAHVHVQCPAHWQVWTQNLMSSATKEEVKKSSRCKGSSSSSLSRPVQLAMVALAFLLCVHILLVFHEHLTAADLVLHSPKAWLLQLVRSRSISSVDDPRFSTSSGPRRLRVFPVSLLRFHGGGFRSLSKEGRPSDRLPQNSVDSTPPHPSLNRVNPAKEAGMMEQGRPTSSSKTIECRRPALTEEVGNHYSAPRESLCEHLNQQDSDSEESGWTVE